LLRDTCMWTHRIGIGCLMLVACFRVEDRDREPYHDYHDDSANGGAASSPPPRGEFCQQWATAACSSAVVSACQASNAEECRQTQAELCRTLMPAEISTTGRDSCIAAVAAAYRDADLSDAELTVVLRFGGPCARTVVGPSGVGEECSAPTDCDLAHGYTCVRKADGSPGTCQMADIVDPGRDCRAAEKTCSTGFFCDGHNCIEALMAGEACSIHEQCGEDGFCNAAGQCAARRKVNDSCESDIECADAICAELAGERVCTDRVVLSRADPVCTNLR